MTVESQDYRTEMLPSELHCASNYNSFIKMNKTNFCLKLQSTGCSTSSVPRKEHNTAAVMEQAALQGHQFTQGHSASQDLD